MPHCNVSHYYFFNVTIDSFFLSFSAKTRRDRVALLVLYLILQFHFYLYALIYVSCIRWKKKMEKKGAGCVEYQHANVYVSRESFLPHPAYHAPDILEVAVAPRCRCYRPELKSLTSWRGDRPPRIFTPDVTDHSRHRASSIVIYRGSERHGFTGASNPDDDDVELEARFEAVEVGPGLRAQVRNLIGASIRREYTCRFPHRPLGHSRIKY